MGKIEGMQLKKLKVLPLGKEGFLFETLRSDDRLFEGVFGQNLVSFVNPGVLKGFHIHKAQTEYTTCLQGDILYVAIKEISGKAPIVEKFEMGGKNRIMIKTPPGVWHGYKNIGKDPAIVLYAMDKPYDPNNMDSEERDPFFFEGVWQRSE